MYSSRMKTLLVFPLYEHLMMLFSLRRLVRCGVPHGTCPFFHHSFRHYLPFHITDAYTYM